MEEIKPVYPAFDLVNRKAKKGYIKEAKKIEHFLVSIETEFEFALFNAPKEITYNDLYTYYLEQWQEVVEKIMLQFKLRYIIVDIHYFTKRYKSVI